MARRPQPQGRRTFGSVRVRGALRVDGGIHIFGGMTVEEQTGPIFLTGPAGEDGAAGAAGMDGAAGAAGADGADGADGLDNTAVQALLAAPFTLNAALATYQDVGLSVDLPGAGTYLIVATVRAYIKGNAGTVWWASGRLWNVTDAAAVANSETMLVQTYVTAVYSQVTSTFVSVVVVAGAKTVRLECMRSGSGGATFTDSAVHTDANGRTRLSYLQVS